MPPRMIALAALFLCTQAAAQQPQQPRPAAPAAAAQLPSLQQLLTAGFDLKAVEFSSGPCGDQPANRGQACRREILFLQSARKDSIFRCERGTWNGQPMQECLRLN